MPTAENAARSAASLAGRVDIAELEEILSRHVHADGPGAQVAISHRGRLAGAAVRGLASLEHRVPITEDTIFHVASVSKQVTAFAVALLAARGLIDLNAPAAHYLPYLPECASGVTVRHLVHHNSGLRDQWCLLLAAGWRMEDVITSGDIVELVAAQQELNFAAGSDYLYSNTGYTLLAAIVTAVSGEAFPAFCRSVLFNPLGMTVSNFVDDHRGVGHGRAESYARTADGYQRCPLNYATVGATSLSSNAQDLLRWADNYRHHRVGGDLDAILYDCGALPDGSSTGYAFGLILDHSHSHRRIWHGGADAGFRAQLTWIPDLDLAVAVLSNLASCDVAQLTEQILAAITNEVTPCGSILPRTPVGDVGAFADVQTGECLDITGDIDAVLVEGIGRFAAVTPRLFRHGPAELEFPARPEQSPTVVLRVLTQTPATLHRIDRASPASATLAEYVGSYRSPELGSTYEVRCDGGQLILHRRKLTPMPLRPSLADAFTGLWGDAMTPLRFAVRFERDSNDGTVEMRLTLSRLRHLRLIRTEPVGAS